MQVHPPRPPTLLQQLEAQAQKRLSKPVYEYYCGAADDELALRENLEAYGKVKVVPRALVDVSKMDLTTKLLGGRITLPSPICVAPTALHKMATPEGEKATNLAAKNFNTLMCVSTLASTPVDEITEGNRWLQVYVFKERSITKQMIEKAEKAGYSALVVTVDTPVAGNRERDVVNKFSLPEGITFANFEGLRGQEKLAMEKQQQVGAMQQIQKDVHALAKDSSLALYMLKNFDTSLTWQSCFQWIRSVSSLPIIVKGIMHPDDAKLALEYGAAGVWISNHGGRQLDSSPGTFEMLPAIADAVGGKIDIYLDGGLRRGADIFKALALGATAVFLGRPILWGLSANGQAGVEQVLNNFKRELELTMALAGASNIEDIRNATVVRSNASILSKL